MKKKRLLIVTNCDPDKVTNCEKDFRKLYAPSGSGIKVAFTHKGIKAYEIKNLVKEKRIQLVIIDEHVSPGFVTELKSRIEHGLLEKAPQIVQVSTKEVIANLKYSESHELVKNEVLAA